jgi:tetratricopeptide (TPR) repeat protein
MTTLRDSLLHSEHPSRRAPRSDAGMRRIIIAAALCACVTLTAACGTRPASSTASTTSATDLYIAKRYSDALVAAERDAATTSGIERERAALIAGQSAYALKREPDADRWLSPLRTSTNDDIAGNASATLGLIAADQRRDGSAAALLAEASRKLKGDDAARAGLFAGDAFERLGNRSQAVSLYQKALTDARDAALKQTIQERLTGRFTIQLGAFSTRAGAERSLGQSAGAFTRAGLPTPAIVQTTDAAGRPLFAVRSGDYPSAIAAQVAASKVSVKTTVVSSKR